jgi:hypothetical protein
MPRFRAGEEKIDLGRRTLRDSSDDVDITGPYSKAQVPAH